MPDFPNTIHTTLQKLLGTLLKLKDELSRRSPQKSDVRSNADYPHTVNSMLDDGSYLSALINKKLADDLGL
jgi:hypothetical protein